MEMKGKKAANEKGRNVEEEGRRRLGRTPAVSGQVEETKDNIKVGKVGVEEEFSERGTTVPCSSRTPSIAGSVLGNGRRRRLSHAERRRRAVEHQQLVHQTIRCTEPEGEPTLPISKVLGIAMAMDGEHSDSDWGAERWALHREALRNSSEDSWASSDTSDESEGTAKMDWRVERRWETLITHIRFHNVRAVYDELAVKIKESCQGTKIIPPDMNPPAKRGVVIPSYLSDIRYLIRSWGTAQKEGLSSSREQLLSRSQRMLFMRELRTPLLRPRVGSRARQRALMESGTLPLRGVRMTALTVIPTSRMGITMVRRLLLASELEVLG